MTFHTAIAGSVLTLAVALTGCASDGSVALSTGSIIEDADKAKKAQRIDPACVSLMARIDELRKEGTPDRIAKVSTGKSKTASVKREALARMTELDKANNEFQQKCSTLASPKNKPAKPAAKSAAVATPPTSTTQAAVKEAAQAPAKTAPATKAAAVPAATTKSASKTTTSAQATTENKKSQATVKPPAAAEQAAATSPPATQFQKTAGIVTTVPAAAAAATKTATTAQ